jgi:hypothetical protein
MSIFASTTLAEALAAEQRVSETLRAELRATQDAANAERRRADDALDSFRRVVDSKDFVLVAREVYEALTLQLSELRSQKAMLEVRCATAQNNVDWFAAQINELRLERAVIFERVLNLRVPTPQIAFTPAESLEGADTSYAPTREGGAPQNYGDVLAIARDAAEVAARARADANSVLGGESISGLFDDVGDKTAKALGLRHEEGAEVS